MSETNLQHYKEDLKEIVKFNFDNPRGVIKKIRETFGYQIKVEIGGCATDEILEWMSLPYKEPILNDKEREYLSAVIKPFRDEVKFIELPSYDRPNLTYTCIRMYDNCGNKIVRLPIFKRGTMYKGMKLDKNYTLEELGL